MAIINGITINGLFEAGVTPFESVSETEISVSVEDAKDPLFLAFDLTGASADTTLSVMDGSGKVYKELSLSQGQLNILPITTFGLRNSQGYIDLKLGNASDIKAAVIAYAAVVNH